MFWCLTTWGWWFLIDSNLVYPVRPQPGDAAEHGDWDFADVLGTYESLHEERKALYCWICNVGNDFDLPLLCDLLGLLHLEQEALQFWHFSERLNIDLDKVNTDLRLFHFELSALSVEYDAQVSRIIELEHQVKVKEVGKSVLSLIYTSEKVTLEKALWGFYVCHQWLGRIGQRSVWSLEQSQKQYSKIGVVSCTMQTLT